MLIRTLLLVLLFVVPAAAQQGTGTIMTGAEDGTYMAIGRDIAALGASCGLSLNVRQSAGSIENMRAVRDRRATQLGIVQSDVLEYYQTFSGDDPALRRATWGVRIAMPLYEEEVHVLARRDIASLADLAGRKVAVGLPDSGTQVTANAILDLTQVAPAERRPIAPAEALDALLRGDLDALFYVVGAPAPLFASDRIDKAAFHLLPLDAPVLDRLYTPAEIAAGTYAFVDAPVKTVAVRAELVTFDFDPRVNAYQASSCRMVSDLSHLILTRLDELKATGHPKWRSVDPGDLPAGWSVSGCALEGVDPGYAFTCRHPDGSIDVDGPAGTAEGDPNQVFRDRVCARLGC